MDDLDRIVGLLDSTFADLAAQPDERENYVTLLSTALRLEPRAVEVLLTTMQNSAEANIAAGQGTRRCLGMMLVVGAVVASKLERGRQLEREVMG